MPPPARTGGDTVLPMLDVIRMAAEGSYYAATPTHPTTNRSSRHQRQGQPHGCQNGLPYPPP
jgi:hypothetical protein